MIREATIADVAELTTLFFTYYQEGNMKKTEWDTNKTGQSIYNGIINDDLLLLVVEKDKKIVGAAYAEFVSPAFSNDLVLHCNVLYLLPEWRKGNIGNSLIKKLDAYAKDKKAKYVHLGITSEIQTERTSRLYEKLGYKHLGYEYRREVA